MTLEEIENKIDEWHESDSSLPLSEYLGMTPDEYENYVKTGNI